MKQMVGRKAVANVLWRTVRAECSVANGTCSMFCGERYVANVLRRMVRGERSGAKGV